MPGRKAAPEERLGAGVFPGPKVKRLPARKLARPGHPGSVAPSPGAQATSVALQPGFLVAPPPSPYTADSP